MQLHKTASRRRPVNVKPEKQEALPKEIKVAYSTSEMAYKTEGGLFKNAYKISGVKNGTCQKLRIKLIRAIQMLQRCRLTAVECSRKDMQLKI
jgi:hypothetical protein